MRNVKGNAPLVFLIVIALVAAGVVGYALMTADTETANTNQANSNAVAVNTNAQTNSTVNTNTSVNGTDNTNTGVDTSGWETYSNEEVGYNIQFPSDWSAVESGTDSARLVPPDADERTSLELAPFIGITIADAILPPDENPQTSPDNCVFNTANVMIGDIQATRQDESCFATYRTTYIPMENQYIRVQWAEVLEEPIYYDIVSTIRLVR